MAEGARGRCVPLAGDRAAPAYLRALARLYMERGQPAMAVPWFENLMGVVGNEERSTIVFKLAKAHLGAKQTDRAIACIEGHLNDDTPALELRALLADLYRETKGWSALARLLTRTLPLLKDHDTAVSYAREAADVYSDKLNSPDLALPALERVWSFSGNT